MKLTPKQQRFIEEYMVDLNATQACIRAGYSKKTATVIGAENLTKPYIKAEVERLRAEQSKKLEITKEGLLQDLMDIKKSSKENFPPAAIKAIEVIGKWLGMDKPDNENVIDDNLDISITIKTKDADKR
jgi:phage terminase small subunit